MIQVCLFWKMSSWSLKPRAWTGTLRSRNQASTTATTTNGTQTNAAFWNQTSLVAPVSLFFITCDAPPMMAKPMIHGVTNCTMLTPKLPMPACRPSAVPCFERGKKYEVLGMKPENAPPPMPARAPRSSRTA